jgi:heat-inducible transcriptional repressor
MGSVMLNSRQQSLLDSIINEYIDTAQPVSSRSLEKSGFFGLKSATIRAEMKSLEESGYLIQFHTSGGRVPTAKAYRYFVDNLIQFQEIEPENETKKTIKKALADLNDDPRQINKSAAQVLSALSENLVIANVIEENDFFKIGLSSLFEMPEMREFETAFRLTSFFDEFESLFEEIAREFFSGSDRHSDDFKIYIGNENPFKEIKDETIMFAKYDLPRNFTGSLTLIGPTRMDYRKNIGLIKYTTEELNKLAKRV